MVIVNGVGRVVKDTFAVPHKSILFSSVLSAAGRNNQGLVYRSEFENSGRTFHAAPASLKAQGLRFMRRRRV